MAERAGVTRASRVVASVALVLSLVSALLFVVGVGGDPHEGPAWVAFFAVLWPIFLGPLCCLAVLVLLFFDKQPLAARLVTLAIAQHAHPRSDGHRAPMTVNRHA